MKKQKLIAKLPNVCPKCRKPIKVGEEYYRYEGHEEIFDFITFEIVKSDFKVFICCENCEDWNILKDVPF